VSVVAPVSYVCELPAPGISDKMLIRLGYDIQFDVSGEVPIVALLNVHPSREKDLREADELTTDPMVAIENYHDTFGNRACRLLPQLARFGCGIPRSLRTLACPTSNVRMHPRSLSSGYRRLCCHIF
jgi:hypothetical protein